MRQTIRMRPAFRAMHDPEARMAKIIILCGKLFDGLSETLRAPAEVLIDDGAIAQVSAIVGHPKGGRK